jgi:chromosome segregation protein
VERLRAALGKLELDRARAALEASSRELELEQLRSTIESSRERVESANQRIAELRERAFEELGERDLEPGRLSGAVNDVVAEIERLRHLVEVIGPVNPLAPQQHREESRRLEDLGIQVDDMEESAAELKKLSRELERAVRGEFMDAFEAIRSSFQKYFELLVGDGSARMSLTDPENLATSGIEIDVRIPGKRRQPLNALSGGERAMVAVALLFAMIDSRGGPVCVLDEVDAALDEANIVRFQNLLDDFADRMQMIMITHNGGSIERASSVFGVAMAADGISQVVSLRLNGVEQPSARREAEAAVQN